MAGRRRLLETQCLHLLAEERVASQRIHAVVHGGDKRARREYPIDDTAAELTVLRGFALELVKNVVRALERSEAKRVARVQLLCELGERDLPLLARGCLQVDAQLWQPRRAGKQGRQVELCLAQEGALGKRPCSAAYTALQRLRELLDRLLVLAELEPQNLLHMVNRALHLHHRLRCTQLPRAVRPYDGLREGEPAPERIHHARVGGVRRARNSRLRGKVAALIELELCILEAARRQKHQVRVAPVLGFRFGAAPLQGRRPRDTRVGLRAPRAEALWAHAVRSAGLGRAAPSSSSHLPTPAFPLATVEPLYARGRPRPRRRSVGRHWHSRLALAAARDETEAAAYDDHLQAGILFQQLRRGLGDVGEAHRRVVEVEEEPRLFTLGPDEPHVAFKEEVAHLLNRLLCERRRLEADKAARFRGVARDPAVDLHRDLEREHAVAAPAPLDRFCFEQLRCEFDLLLTKLHIGGEARDGELLAATAVLRLVGVEDEGDPRRDLHTRHVPFEPALRVVVHLLQKFLEMLRKEVVAHERDKMRVHAEVRACDRLVEPTPSGQHTRGAWQAQLDSGFANPTAHVGRQVDVGAADDDHPTVCLAAGATSCVLRTCY